MSFLSEVGILISNTLIVNRLGAAEYATMYFWAISLSMIFYIVFSAFKESAVRVFYGVVLAALLGNSIYFYYAPDTDFALKAFIVSFFLVDFIGPNVFSGVLISNSSPTVFREVFQKMLSLQLFARILGSLTMASLSHFDSAGSAIYIFWFVLAAHAFSLVKVVTLSRQEAKALEVKPSWRQMKSAFTFLFNNPFIRLVLQISILANAIRILVDYFYLQKVGSFFVGTSEVGTFLSTVSLATIVLVYIFQSAIGKKLVLSKNLGLLYSIQPIGIILLGVLTVIVPGIAVPVLLMIFTQCSGRGIQLPLFRQSMVALPKELRSSVMFILSIFLSGTGLGVTAVLSATKNYVHFNALVFTLFAVSIILLLIVTKLDSFYVKNLWSSYKEMREGQWLERRLGQSQSPFHLVTQMSMIALEETQEDNPFDEDKTRTAPAKSEEHNPLKRLSNLLRTDPRHEEVKNLLTFCLSNERVSISTKRILLRRVYEACYDREVLKVASEFHKDLLFSEEPKEILEGIRLAETLGHKRLKKILRPHLHSKDALVVQAAEMAFATETLMESLPTAHLSSITIRKLRSVARDFIETGEEAKFFTKMEWLLQNQNEKRVRAVIDTLYHPKFSMVRENILLCIDVKAERFTIFPLLRQMFNMDYSDGQEVRWALRRIGFEEEKALVFIEVNRILSTLLEKSFTIWDKAKFDDHKLKNLFLQALFLEEWVDSMYVSISYFTHTIKDLMVSEGQQREMLASIHLEYLKRNASYPVWKAIMNQNATTTDWALAKKELTRLLVNAS